IPVVFSETLRNGGVHVVGSSGNNHEQPVKNGAGHNQFGQRGSETGAGAIDVLPSPYSKYRANDVAMDQVSRLLCGGKPRRRREKTEYGQPFSKPFFARGKQPEWS